MWTNNREICGQNRHGGREGASWYNHVRFLRDLRVEVSRGFAEVERTPQRTLFSDFQG